MCHAAVQGIETDFSTAPAGVPFADDESDLCYVTDCAAGIQALLMADNLQHHVYNIGSGRSVTQGDIAEVVRSVVPDARIRLQPGRGPFHRSRAYLDIARMGQDVGYRPQYDIERGVAEHISWLRSQQE